MMHLITRQAYQKNCFDFWVKNQLSALKICHLVNKAFNLFTFENDFLGQEDCFKVDFLQSKIDNFGQVSLIKSNLCLLLLIKI